MIYGNKWLSLAESTKEEVKDEYNIESLVYDEYLNRKSLLEACTDEAAKPILEAQVEVLREVSIKDIIDKIKEAIHNIFQKVKEIIERIVNFVKKLFSSKEKNSKFKSSISNSKLIRDIKDKPIKMTEESTYDDLLNKLIAIYNDLANNKNIYFDYNFVISTKADKLSDKLNYYIDEFKKMNSSKYENIENNKAYKELKDDYNFAFTEDNSVMNNNFINRYFKGTSRDINKAIDLYLSEAKHKNFMSTPDSLNKWLVSNIDSNIDELDEIKKICNNLEKIEPALLSAANDIKLLDANEYDKDKINSHNIQDNEKVKRHNSLVTAYQWLKEIMGLLTKNINICNVVTAKLIDKHGSATKTMIKILSILSTEIEEY